jgi:hypothetical protein
VKRERVVATTRESHGVTSWWHPSVLYKHSSSVPASVVRESSYRRFVGLPTMSSIESSGVTPKECTLGAALVIAQRRR